MHALTGSSCKELTCQRLAVPEGQRSLIHLLLPLLVPHLWPAHSRGEIVASNTTLNPGLNPQTHHKPMLQQKLYDQLSSSPSTRTTVHRFWSETHHEMAGESTLVVARRRYTTHHSRNRIICVTVCSIHRHQSYQSSQTWSLKLRTRTTFVFLSSATVECLEACWA
jgi:hypothetical protein